MKAKASHIATVLSFCAIFAAALFLWIFAPKSNIEEEENRSAAKFPRISARSIWDGDFFEGFSRYISDSFPMRQELISTNSKLKLYSGECEINNVFCSKEYLIFKGEYNSLEIAKSNLSAISNISGTFNAPFTVAIIPRSCDVNIALLPKIYSNDRSREIYTLIDDQLPTASSLRKFLLQEISNIDQAFYRTDHHLTTEGAYATYKTIIEDMGYTAHNKNAFSVQTVSEKFLGTAQSRSSIKNIVPDSVTLYRYDGDESYSVYSHTDNKKLSLYDFSALDKKDKYQIFLGGNHAYISLEDRNRPRPRLLIIKDSFANAMIPFFAIDFNLDIIDPRYCQEPVNKLIDGKKYGGIIFIFGADTLASTAMHTTIK